MLALCKTLSWLKIGCARSHNMQAAYAFSIQPHILGVKIVQRRPFRSLARRSVGWTKCPALSSR